MHPSSNREVAIFNAALELDSTQRAAYLDVACANDPAFRLHVEELLRVHEAAISFLAAPASGVKSEGDGSGVTARLSATPAEKTGDRISRYKLLEQIGEGGCGVVYMAEQEQPVRRRVALKVIKLGMDTRHVVARFSAERQALALMDHPNIAKVFDAGATETGRPYFVMELVRGIKMTDYCDQNQLSPQERLKLFVQVCQAIQHAHQKGIIHRDIKPSNILVTVSDPGSVPCPKVIDFGIAKAITGDRLTDKTVFTAFEQFIGTPAYMSPEQAAMTDLDIDTRTDVYSLGVLLYELLTGDTPLGQKALPPTDLERMRFEIRETEPDRPSTRLSTMVPGDLTIVAQQRRLDPPKLIHLLRGDLDWIVMKALEKDRARRYETANGLAMDVQRYLADEPVVARPPSQFYRFQKMVRRNKLAFAAAVAISTVLLLGGVVSTVEAIRATRAERGQLQLRNRAEEAVQRLELQRAEEWLASDNSRQGLVALARLLRDHPNNLVAAHRLVSALTQRSFCLPVFEPLHHRKSVTGAEFSPDGRKIATASLDATAQLWDAETGKALGSPLRHLAGVNCARFSPNGEKILTCSEDMTARVWETRTGLPGTPLLRHVGPVKTGAFSSDSEWVVTASDDGTARVWNVGTGEPAFGPLKHDGALTSVEFSPDDRWILTASQDGTARLWDARSGRPEPFLFRHAGPVNRATFSPDGRWIATASDDHTAQVWDRETGQHLTQPLQHQQDVYFVQFSPDGQRVASASLDRTACLWDVRTGRPLGKPLTHDAQLSSVRFSPDGLRVVTACEDSTARVWDAFTGKPLTEAMNHENKLFGARFSPDGQRVVTASEDSTARVWDVRLGRALSRSLRHASSARQTQSGSGRDQILASDWSAARPASAQVSADGKRMVTFSGDQIARIWDTSTWRESTPPLRHDGWVTCAEFSPNGQAVVTGCAGASAESWAARTAEGDSHWARERREGASASIWDARTGTLLNQLRHSARVTSVQISPDGSRVVTASWDKTARVWDARTGQPITDRLVHGDAVSSARFSPDGKWIVTAAGDDTARMWDARTGQPFGKPMQHGGWVHYAEFSPDGSRVVSAASDSTARVWDARTGEPITPPLQHQGALCFARFSPDGLRIATCSWDKTARLWDSRSGRALTEPLRHGDVVQTIWFRADGECLLTSSEDRTARIWDSRTGQPLSDPLRGDDEMLSSACFAPNGRQVISAPLNGTFRVWETPGFELPIPAWLPGLAEAVVGRRLTEDGSLEIVPSRKLFELMRNLGSEPSADTYNRWAQWFFADRSTRAISAESGMTVPDYVDMMVQQKTEASLREAMLLAPKRELAQRPK